VPGSKTLAVPEKLLSDPEVSNSRRPSAPTCVVRDEYLRVPMRDGVTLHARLWRPDADEPLPVVFNHDPYRSSDMRTLGRGNIFHWLARHGFVAVHLSVRGTFTDVALEVGETLHTTKILTTHAAPERAVLEGIQKVIGRAGSDPGEVSLIVYGTTLATNLLIERKGSPIALLTTAGFRDTIEMRNENRYEQYDLGIDLPVPLVPRARRFPVNERINAKGKVLVPLDEAAVEALAPRLEECGVGSVAIAFLHSYMNDAHERRARELLLRRLPSLEVTLSCEVSPEMREYERFSTACANAYVQPLMSAHLAGLQHELEREGFVCPLFLMLSGGGLTTLETAIRFPVRLVESGPAGGAIFASHVARTLDLGAVVSYDMGGTTAKICLIDDALPQTSRTFEVARVYRFMKGSGIPLRIPVIEMVEIGAGGGSIAEVDSMRRIAVGPESAGSEPGPACYGRDGGRPTVTDADLVLGRIHPDHFAGGRMRLDRRAADEALRRGVGERLGVEPAHAALGVSEIVDENMSNAARVHAIESGKEIEPRTLVAFGGAAPLHAARIAEKLGMRQVVVPRGAGVGSAIGFLRAPIAYELTRSFHQRIGALDLSAVNDLLASMRAQARSVVEAGAGGRPLSETRTAFMRYVGQGHEVGVELPVRIDTPRLEADGAEVLMRAFEREYERLYERTIPNLDAEILTWVLMISTDGTSEPHPRVVYDAPEEAATSTRVRTIMDSARGEYIEVSEYRRDELGAGAMVRGPAVIVEEDTTTMVTARFDARVHPLGYIVMERRGADPKGDVDA